VKGELLRRLLEKLDFSTVVGLFGFEGGYISDRGPVSILMEMVYHYNYITLVSFEGEDHKYRTLETRLY
jgi:hypothetical protein